MDKDVQEVRGRSYFVFMQTYESKGISCSSRSIGPGEERLGHVETVVGPALSNLQESAHELDFFLQAVVLGFMLRFASNSSCSREGD